MSPSDATTSPTVPSFRTRILRAGGWTFGGHMGAQIIRLLSNLVMTRLLVPQMFGVMALANVLLTGLQLFSDLGLGQGIIQSKRGADPVYINTVWTAQIVRGLFIWVISVLIVVGLMVGNARNLLPPDTVYSDPHLPALLFALSFNAILVGLVSTRVSTASRNLALGRVTLMEITGQATAIVVMVAWALLVDRSAWALVVGSLVSNASRVLWSHTWLPGEKNRLTWDRDSLHDMFHFGKWVFITSILGFLASSGDRLLLGGLVDAKTLGIYVTAYFLVTAVQEVFSKVTNNVAFPAFSEVYRERPQDLRKTYYKFRASIDAVSLFATGGMFAAGHLIVAVLYDSRYQQAGHILEILSVGLFEVRYNLSNTCLVAMGKPKLIAPVIATQLLVLFLMVPWAFHHWGLEAAIWVIGSSLLFTIPVTFYFKIRNDLIDWKRELIVLPWLLVGYGCGILVARVAQMIGLVR